MKGTDPPPCPSIYIDFLNTTIHNKQLLLSALERAMPMTYDEMMLDLFNVIFGRVCDNIGVPEQPYQYSISLPLDNGQIKAISKELTKRCDWCYKNIGSGWYINPKAFDMGDNENEVTVEFNFANESDLMAFKLRWI